MAATNTNGITGAVEEGGGALMSGVSSFLSELGQALPNILAAAVILIVGYLIAKGIGSLVHRLVLWSKVDNLIRKSNAARGNDEGAVKMRIADVAGTLTKWFVVLLVVAVAADVLQWEQITALVNSFIAYVPNIAAAILLLVGGYLLGNFIASVISGMTDTLSPRAAGMFGNIARWAIFVFAVMAALIQLGIAESIIQIAFIGLMAMLSLAGGLAFGLGGRDKARELLSDISPKRPMGAA